MRYRFFRIPAMGDGDPGAEELNRFLGEARIVQVEREFVSDGERSAWCFCVSYLEHSSARAPIRQGRIDYKEVLSPEQFAVFARLRLLRKEAAEKDGVPPYAVFTNEQLATMVTTPVRTKSDLAALPGVGPARLAKYGAAFLAALEVDGEMKQEQRSED